MRGMRIMMLFLVVCMLSLSACSGPETRILTKREAAEEEGRALVEIRPSLEAGNPYSIEENLNYMTFVPCDVGSGGEQLTALYLIKVLRKYGYQPVRHKNIIRAQRIAEDPEADIMIVFTSYGTNPDSVGTTQSVAGTCVLLETARLLSRVPTDTNVEFVFLPDVPDSLVPLRNYLQMIPEQDLGKIIGAVQVGPQGYHGGGTLVLTTPDGEATMLTEQFHRTMSELWGKEPECVERQTAAISAFARKKIPSMAIKMIRNSRECGTVFDQKRLVDPRLLAENAEALGQTLYHFMDPETPYLIAKSRYYTNIRDEAYPQGKEPVLPFGEDRETLEAVTGQEGLLIDQTTDQTGMKTEVYRYPMHWFGQKEEIQTDYYYKNGVLYDVILQGSEAGISYEDMQALMERNLGDYTGHHSVRYGTAYDWDLERQRIGWSMVPGRDSYQLSVHEYKTRPIVLAQDSLAADKIHSLIGRVLPVQKEDLKIEIYTDGKGGTKGFIDKAIGENGESWKNVIWIDQLDLLSSSGAWINEPEAVDLLLRLYIEKKRRDDPDYYLAHCPSPDTFDDDFRWFIYEDLPSENMSGMKERMEYFYRFPDLVFCREFFQENHG